MKISHAYLCYSCNEILDGAPQGKCTACNNGNVFPLGWLDRPEEERADWLSRIRANGTAPRTALRLVSKAA
jgi:hypothetical protein